MSNLELRGTIARNATDEILIHAGKYGSFDVVDIRWYINDKPQRKGIRMNIEEMKKLHVILDTILKRNKHERNSGDMGE